MTDPNKQPDAHRPGYDVRTFGDTLALGTAAHHFTRTHTRLARTATVGELSWIVPGTEVRMPAEVAVQVSEAVVAHAGEAALTGSK